MTTLTTSGSELRTTLLDSPTTFNKHLTVTVIHLHCCSTLLLLLVLYPTCSSKTVVVVVVLRRPVIS